MPTPVWVVTSSTPPSWATDVAPLGWQPGEDRMLLVSIGTGTEPDANANLKPGELNLLYNATHIPSALMATASAQQDLLCRGLGRCRHGAELDREFGDVTGQAGEGTAGPGKLFSYLRYNVDLTQPGLDALGLSRIRAADVQQMDSVAHINDLSAIGRAAAALNVKADHFTGFPA
jgi:uncharacterized protein